MRICLFGEFYGYIDEGMRKTSYYLSKELSKYHQVLALDIRDFLNSNFWDKIKLFSPDVFHYLHGPSIKSLLIMRIISLYYNNASTVISAFHPEFSFLSKQFIPLLKPNLLLVQSQKTEEFLNKYGCTTIFFPPGVDTTLFRPISLEEKQNLREKYGIQHNKYIILHVGSIKEARNVQLFKKLQIDNNQVVIVGAISTGINKNLAQYLENIGCIVFPHYIDSIEEIYSLSDCYIFPTTNETASIEFPLSVLEAMASNLPVISTKFGALPRVFSADEGLIFTDNENDFHNHLECIKNYNGNVNTRSKILTYSWENVAHKLEDIYIKLIDSEKNEI